VGAGYAIAHKPVETPPETRSRVLGRPLVRGAAPAPGEVGEAIQAALTDPDRLAGVEALAAQLRRTGPESLPEVLAAFETVFLDVAELEVVLLADWWADFDPKGAFQWSRGSAIGRHPLVLRAVVEAWAQRDPLAARDALTNMKDPFMARACLDSLISGWDASGQPGLIEYLRGLGASTDALMAMSPLARRRVLRDGPERAFAWGEAIPDDPPDDALRFKLQMFRRLVSAAAPIDPEKTAAFAAKYADGPHGDGLLARTGAGWATQIGDGVPALRWLASPPAGKQRDDGVEETFQAWSGRNYAAAAAWLEAEPHAAWMEPAILIHVNRLSGRDVAAALAWARRIEQPALRESAFVAVGNMWLQNDPEAARAWLDGDEPTASIREEILKLEQLRTDRVARREARKAASAAAAAAEQP
jgi:hypothetical protein